MRRSKILLQVGSKEIGLLQHDRSIVYYNMKKAVVPSCSVEKLFTEISQNSQENSYVSVSFLMKLQVLDLQLNKKETLAQVFSCEFYEISKNTFFYRTPPVAASKRESQY